MFLLRLWTSEKNSWNTNFCRNVGCARCEGCFAWIDVFIETNIMRNTFKWVVCWKYQHLIEKKHISSTSHTPHTHIVDVRKERNRPLLMYVKCIVFSMWNELMVSDVVAAETMTNSDSNKRMWKYRSSPHYILKKNKVLWWENFKRSAKSVLQIRKNIFLWRIPRNARIKGWREESRVEFLIRKLWCRATDEGKNCGNNK